MAALVAAGVEEPKREDTVEPTKPLGGGVAGEDAPLPRNALDAGADVELDALPVGALNTSVVAPNRLELGAETVAPNRLVPLVDVAGAPKRLGAALVAGVEEPKREVAGVGM